jgi:8-oxo-dGTP diphosphatase
MSSSPLPKIRVVSALIEREGRFLVTQRRAEASLPLLWEFPGGKVEPGETDPQALQRELRERLGIEVRVAQREVEVDHEYQGYSLHLRTYRCHLTDGSPRAVHVADFRWASPAELAQLPFPGADQASVDALIEDL